MSNSAAEQQAILAAVKQEIAKSLRQGKKKDEIIQRLVARGLNPEKAAILVDQVDRETVADLDDLNRLRSAVRNNAIQMILGGGAVALVGIGLTAAAIMLAEEGFLRRIPLATCGAAFFGGAAVLKGIVDLTRSYTMR